MSRVKKSVKNATVERRVASRRMVVKINQPCSFGISGGAQHDRARGRCELTIRKNPNES